MDGVAIDSLGFVRQGQRKPPVDQAAEQQVEISAVIFDVGFQPHKHPLIIVIRRIVNVLHVGIIQHENVETDVEALRDHKAFELDFVSGTADTLFGNAAYLWYRSQASSSTAGIPDTVYEDASLLVLFSTISFAFLAIPLAAMHSLRRQSSDGRGLFRLIPSRLNSHPTFSKISLAKRKKVWYSFIS